MIRKQIKFRAFFAFILVFGAFLRILTFFKEFSGDEARIFRVTLGLRELIHNVCTTDVFPPLSYIFLYFWTNLFSIHYVRLYFILFGLATVVLIYFMVKDAFGKKVALIGVAISSFSPLLIWASGYARSYIDSGFFALLATFLLFKIIKNDNKISLYFFYAIVALISLYMFYYNLFVIIAHSIYFLFTKRRRITAIFRWVIGQVFMILVFSPWVLVAYKQINFNATNVSDYIDLRGFQIFGFHIGIFLRNIAAIFGADPYFLNSQELSSLNYGLLIVLLCIIVLFISIFIYRKYSILKDKEFLQRNAYLFFIIFILLFTMILGEFINLLPRPRYQVVLHVFFIIIFSKFLFDTYLRNKSILFVIITFVVFFYSFRIGLGALKPEVEYSVAYKYLQSNIKKDDCLVATRFIRDISTFNDIKIIEVDSYFEDAIGASGCYTSFKKGKFDDLKNKICVCRRILLLNHAYDEFSGANDLITNFIKEMGFRIKNSKYFKGMSFFEFIK